MCIRDRSRLLAVSLLSEAHAPTIASCDPRLPPELRRDPVATVILPYRAAPHGTMPKAALDRPCVPRARVWTSARMLAPDPYYRRRARCDHLQQRAVVQAHRRVPELTWRRSRLYRPRRQRLRLRPPRSSDRETLHPPTQSRHREPLAVPPISALSRAPPRAALYAWIESAGAK